MEGATLLSLGQPLLEKVFSYNFPINMLRAVACCQQLHTALGEKLKASTHFARADWVILGEIDKPGCNGRVGQIIQLRPGDRTRYAVQVDGPDIWTMTLSQDIGLRPVSLSRFKLQKIPATVCAVRLFTEGEMYQNLIPSDSVTLTCKEFRKTFAVSAARIPSQLAIFSSRSGRSPIMEALVRPVVLREVISAHDLKLLPGDMQCHASYLLHFDQRASHNDRWAMEVKFFRASHEHDARVVRTGPSSGPTIIAWKDQSDFTLDDMKQVWEFQEKALMEHLRIHASVPKDTLVRLWKEAGLVNGIGTQEVFHEEPPAVIKPDEARRLVEAQLASTIQSEPVPPTMGELASVLTFHRTPASLDRAVSESDSGRRLLEKGVNLKPCWANGAKILVEGLTEDIWKQACRDAGENPELRPKHVVIPSNALSEILAEVQKIPHSSRPRIKAGQATISVPDLSQFTDLSDTGARGSQESSYAFIPANSSTVSSEMSGWAAFIDGLRKKIMHVPLGPLNVTRGFIHEPEEAPITPRSEATESEHGNLGINPHLFR